MKNKLYIIVTLLYTFYINAQVNETVTIGSGSTTTTRTFIVDENFRVRDLQDKTNDINYKNVLVADGNGNINKVDKNSFVGTVDNNDNKLFYLSPEPLVGVVEVGDFVFYFRPKQSGNGYVDVMIRLKNQPSASLNIFHTLFHKYNTYDLNWTSPNTAPTDTDDLNQKRYRENFVNFTTSDWNTGKVLIQGLNIGDFAEMWLSYPDKATAYRAVFYVRQNSGAHTYNMSKNFTILVEMFNNN